MLSNNPYKKQSFVKQLLTPEAPNRSPEEEQKRLQTVQKVSTLANAMKLMGNIAGLGMGADVAPSNDQVMPYTVNRINELKEIQRQDQLAERDAMLQNMYKAKDYDVTEQRRKEDKQFRSKEAQEARNFRDQEAEESRTFRDQETKEKREYQQKRDEKWRLTPEQQMQQFRDKEAYKQKNYLERINKKDKKSNAVFAVMDEKGNKIAELTKEDINTLYTKFNTIPDESLSKMPVSVRLALKMGDKLTDDNKMDIIEENWDVLEKYYDASESRQSVEVTPQENQSIEKMNFVLQNDKLQPAQKADIIIPILIKDFGYTPEEAKKTAYNKAGIK